MNILKMVCAICSDVCIFVNRDYCAKEFVIVCKDCFKGINPK